MRIHVGIVISIFFCIQSAWSAKLPVEFLHARGMAICHNSLSLSATDTIGIWGNLYLVQAEITGGGTLALVDSTPQQLHAQDSRLPRLAVLNPDTVSLHGDLLITDGLSIDAGVLDVRCGILQLHDPAQVFLSRGGQLLDSMDSDRQLSDQPLLSRKPQRWLPLWPVTPAAGPSSLHIHVFPASPRSVDLVTIEKSRRGYCPPASPAPGWGRIPEPPPRRLTGSKA